MTNMLLKDFPVLFSLKLSCCCKVFISFLERLIIWSLLFITFCKSLIMLCKYFVSLKALFVSIELANDNNDNDDDDELFLW